uniref:Farnesoic acid O-methyl transferase domain-containing protein n=1 Tax=Cacopsylla melanoneura TaxID=428564 RepID=A0A8D9E302_9HEMI
MTKSISIIIGCFLFGDLLIVPLLGACVGNCSTTGNVAYFDGRPIELITDNKLDHYEYYKLAGKSFQFLVKAPSNVYVKFSPNILIVIGGWFNTRSVICNQQVGDQTFCIDFYVDEKTPGIVNAHEYKGFWVTVHADRTILVGLAGKVIPFMKYTHPEPLQMNYAGLGIFNDGSFGQFQIYGVVPQFLYWAHDVWEKSQDHAFQAGQDITGEPLYIIRLRHKDPLTVYNYFPSLRFVSFGYGKLTNGMYPHPEQSYEVLCGGANATWVRAGDDVRPPNAFPSGSTKDGDTLYICRASYGNTLAVGQVASDNICYFVLDDGIELIAKDKFEVLVY